MSLRFLSTPVALGILAAFLFVGSNATADVIFDPPEIEACYGKSDDEACTLDGEAGLCQRGGANGLRCVVGAEADPEPEPDTGGSGNGPTPTDDDGGCSTVLANPVVTPALSFMLGLFILAGVRRRKSRDS